MKVHELIAKLNQILKDAPSVGDYDIVVEEMISSYQENIESIDVSSDFFQDKDLVVIRFRNQ